LDEDALAEGEELDSNILSQDFAPVRTTMARGRKCHNLQGRGSENRKEIVRCRLDIEL
jgi:hypothetical protein